MSEKVTLTTTAGAPNNAAEAMQGVPQEIVERQLGHFAKADPRYAEGVAHALRMPFSQAAE
jgi:catalase